MSKKVLRYGRKADGGWMELQYHDTRKKRTRSTGMLQMAQASRRLARARRP